MDNFTSEERQQYNLHQLEIEKQLGAFAIFIIGLCTGAITFTFSSLQENINNPLFNLELLKYSWYVLSAAIFFCSSFLIVMFYSHYIYLEAFRTHKKTGILPRYPLQSTRTILAVLVLLEVFIGMFLMVISLNI